MTHEECEDMSFHVSQLEGLVKGYVSKRDLEKSMYNLRKDLEKGMEGSVKTLNFANLQIHVEERMNHLENIVGHMENTMGHMENTVGHMKDDIVKIIVKVLKNLEEKILKGDDVGQGTQEVKDSVLVDPPSIKKHALKGFDFNIGSNKELSTRCIQLP